MRVIDNGSKTAMHGTVSPTPGWIPSCLVLSAATVPLAKALKPHCGVLCGSALWAQLYAALPVYRLPRGGTKTTAFMQVADALVYACRGYALLDSYRGPQNMLLGRLTTGVIDRTQGCDSVRKVYRRAPLSRPCARGTWWASEPYLFSRWVVVE